MSFFYNFKKKNNNKNKDITLYHTGANLPAMAAENFKIKSIYLSHGLIGKDSQLAYPYHQKAYLYSNEEIQYLKKIRPKTILKLYNYKKIHKNKKRIIIFLRMYDRNMDFDKIKTVIRFFDKLKYKIYIKRHSNCKSIMYKSLKNENIIFLNKNYLGSEAIEKIKPTFIISWLSTVISEAINSNVIPITFYDKTLKKDKEKIKRMIFPINKRSLNWDKDKKKITLISRNLKEFKKQINILINK